LPRADDKEASTSQDAYKNKIKWDSIYQEAQPTSSWTRGLMSEEKKRKIIKCESYRKMSQEIVYGTGMSIFFEPIPEKIRL
jgi:hypothetical protein